MEAMKQVLLVTNSTTEEEINLIKQALTQAKERGIPIQLRLVHVIPNLPTCYFSIPSMVMVAEQYYEDAKRCLASIGGALGIEKKDQWLMTGRVKNEVLRLANKIRPDFILASNNHIQDLNKSFLFRRTPNFSLRQIKNMGSL